MVRLSSIKKDEIVRNITSKLAPCRRSTVLQIARKELNQFKLSDTQFANIKKSLFEQLHKLPLKWQKQPHKTELFSPYPDPSQYELIGAFGESAYTCYFSALYCNELSRQVPETFYLAIPRKAKNRKSVSDYKDLDFEVVRDVFMKKPTELAVSFRFKDAQYVFVERDSIHSIGVMKKEIIQNGRRIAFAVTDIEGTLIDCAIAPHRSGGINSVIEAFRLAGERLDIGKLYYYYSSQRFIYPYWQRIGYLLEKAGLTRLANKWEQLFSVEKQDFFLTHEYRSSWALDEHWKLYHPHILDSIT